MSAPKTDLDKQEKRHRGPLGGMAFVVALALSLLLGLTVWLSMKANMPDGAEVAPDNGSAAAPGSY